MPEDLDITIQLQLQPLMAWYGVKRQIQGSGGKKLWVEVPAGIRNKTRLRLKGEGKIRGSSQGDLYIEVQIEQSKALLLRRGLAALGSVALGGLLMGQLSDSTLFELWIVLGYTLITFGIIVLMGIFLGEYLGKREVGALVFLLCCGGPPLLINGFVADIAFSWLAAFSCATIGGVVGGLLICPKPMLSGLIGGIVAGNSSLAVIYYYTLHNEIISNYEIVALLILGCLPGVGVGWLLKKGMINFFLMGSKSVNCRFVMGREKC
jgi:hypothetical protein